jgi:DNA-binding transcriptional LysR family regulator
MKIHQLRALIAIADAGSVRGAARTLNSSPAAVTQNIQQLEEAAHVQLVVRTSSGVTLTECGQTLLLHARLVAAQMVRAHQAMDAMRGEPSGRLSRMPAIQLELFEGLLAIATPRLRDGSLDIYVGRQSPSVSACDFNYQPLFATSRAVVARLGHPRAESRSLAELLDDDWLVALDPETEGHAPYQMFSRYGLPVPRSIHFLHSLTVAVALLKRTDMVSIFPWPLVELCAARDGLCAIPLREELEDSTVGIITRTGEPSDAASQCFIDCLLETIRDESWGRTTEIRRAMQSVEVLV